MESMTRRGIRPLLLCAAVGVGFLAGTWSSEHRIGQPSLMAQVQKDLKHGEYLFFPTRRSVWVVNRTNGRMAVYTFLNNEYSTVERSRVAQIDPAGFPREDTIIQISDRNLSSNLWVCNVRTGDVQMWTVTRDGEVKMTGPVPTMTDLMARP